MSQSAGNPLSRYVQGFYNYRFGFGVKSAAYKTLTGFEKFIGLAVVFGIPIGFNFHYWHSLPQQKYTREIMADKLVNVHESPPNAAFNYPKDAPTNPIALKSMYDHVGVRPQVVFGPDTKLLPHQTVPLVGAISRLRHQQYMAGVNTNMIGNEFNRHRYLQSNAESRYQALADEANIRLGMVAHHNMRDANFFITNEKFTRKYHTHMIPDPAVQYVVDNDKVIQDTVAELKQLA